MTNTEKYTITFAALFAWLEGKVSLDYLLQLYFAIATLKSQSRADSSI